MSWFRKKYSATDYNYLAKSSLLEDAIYVTTASSENKISPRSEVLNIVYINWKRCGTIMEPCGHLYTFGETSYLTSTGFTPSCLSLKSVVLFSAPEPSWILQQIKFFEKCVDLLLNILCIIFSNSCVKTISKRFSVFSAFPTLCIGITTAFFNQLGKFFLQHLLS